LGGIETPCRIGSFSTVKGALFCQPHATCVAGQRVANAGTNTTDQLCEDCVAGQFSASANSPGCSDCPVGKYQLNASQPFCDVKQACNPGTYESNSSLSSLDRCKDCPKAQFSNEPNSQACTPCPLGKYADKQGARFCNDVNTAQFIVVDEETGETKAADCPAATASGHGSGALCQGGSLRELPGFWRDSAKGSQVNGETVYYHCPQEGSCLGGTECKEGHGGVLCAVCARGFAMKLGACAKCPGAAGASEAAGMAFVMLSVLAVTVLVFKKRNKLKKAFVSDRSKSLLKVAWC
jgi:hypothetical protein